WGIAHRCRARPPALTCHSRKSAPTTTATVAAFSTAPSSPASRPRRPHGTTLHWHRHDNFHTFLLHDQARRAAESAGWCRTTCHPMEDIVSSRRRGAPSQARLPRWRRSATVEAAWRRRVCHATEADRCHRCHCSRGRAWPSRVPRAMMMAAVCLATQITWRRHCPGALIISRARRRMSAGAWHATMINHRCNRRGVPRRGLLAAVTLAPRHALG
ncbi:unnamed protein product, partial [Urochloa humidicola]